MKTEHFYPELARVYSDYPWLTFDRALNVAARTLCTIGLVWRVDLDPVSYAEGESGVMLFPPNDTRIVQIMESGGLQRVTQRQLALMDGQWRSRSGVPTHFYRLPDDSLGLYPSPPEDRLDAITVRAAIAPTTESKTLSDGFAWDYERLLLDGAFAYLGRTQWRLYEQQCREVRSFATDEAQIGVARTVKYGGL